MALGSVLLKPQPVATPLPPTVDPVELVVDFIEVFTRNPEGTAAAARILVETLPPLLAAWAQGHEEKLRLADGRIRHAFRHYAAVRDQLLAAVQQEAIVDVLSGLLGAVELLLRQLGRRELCELVRALADIAVRDLGLSAHAVRDVATTVLTGLVAELQRDLIQGQTSRAALARYEAGAVLAGLLSLADDGLLEGPVFGIDLLIEVIEAVWARGPVDRLLAWVRELLARRDDLLAPLAALLEARLALKVDVSVRARGAPRAAEAPAGEPPIAWYASWVAQQTVRAHAAPAPVGGLSANPFLEGITFAVVDEQAMEKLAFHTAWATPVLEALVFHAPSMESGDVLSNLHILVLDAIDVFLQCADHGPIPRWWHWTMKPVMTHFLFGFESGWDRRDAEFDPYAWMNGLADFGEWFLYWRWTRVLREALLSFFTLLNHEPGRTKGKPCNADFQDGVAYLFWEVGAMIVPLVTLHTSRHQYGFVGGGPPVFFLGAAFGGQAVSMGLMYGSAFLSRVIAGEFFRDPRRYALQCFRERLFGPFRFQADFSGAGEGFDSVGGWLGTPLACTYSGVGLFLDGPMYSFLFHDGATDGGTYAVDGRGEAAEGLAFRGYIDAQDSPYLLPWAGTTMQCTQGNMGIWSHYPGRRDGKGTVQMYSYDFSHDLGQEILCSRAGIVWSVQAGKVDNSEDGPNHLEVMHLIVIEGSGGLAAVEPPAWKQPADDEDAKNPYATFADGVTAIPQGTLFPPYWDAEGKPWPGLADPVPLHPSAAILPGATLSAPGSLPDPPPSYYDQTTGFRLGTTFRFLDPQVDRGLVGKPAGPVFDDGSPQPLAGGVVAPDVAVPPPAGTVVYPAGTDFVFDDNTQVVPLFATFATYMHCMYGFPRISDADAPGSGGNASPDFEPAPRPEGLPDLYRSGEPDHIRGLFVRQGQPIALAGDTGTSMYNHLHMQVCGTSRRPGTPWTLPFVFRDAEHLNNGLVKMTRRDGVPRAFTYYRSRNVRLPSQAEGG